jgi:DNA polymerase III epsilon subunit family exonuclease
MAQPTDLWTAFDYAVVDVEGNGQRPPDLVEIAIVAIKGGLIGRPKSWLVRPPRPITPMARRLHKITDDQVVDAPAVADIEAELLQSLSDKVFVAHNAHVDLGVLGVLGRELPAFQPARVVDTLKLARRLLPGRDSYTLGALVDAFGLARGLPVDLVPHRATYDALVCARLLAHLATPPGHERLTLAELLDTTAGKTASNKAAVEASPTLF